MRRGMSPFLALFGHAGGVDLRPLLGAKRTLSAPNEYFAF